MNHEQADESIINLAGHQRGVVAEEVGVGEDGDAPLADRLLALEHRKLAYDGAPTGFGGFGMAEVLAGEAAGAPAQNQGGPACCA